MGERLTCNQDVRGSNPRSGTNNTKELTMNKCNEAPKCDECGKFIPWINTTVTQVLAYNMQHEPYEDDLLGGLCDKCKSK